MIINTNLRKYSRTATKTRTRNSSMKTKTTKTLTLSWELSSDMASIVLGPFFSKTFFEKDYSISVFSHVGGRYVDDVGPTCASSGFLIGWVRCHGNTSGFAPFSLTLQKGNHKWIVSTRCYPTSKLLEWNVQKSRRQQIWRETFQITKTVNW